MKRKLLTVLLTLIAALCLCFAFAACDNESDDSGTTDTGSNTEQGDTTKPDDGGEQTPEHVHSFTDYVYNNDATCTEDGTETAFCSCGETDTRTKEDSALGHDYHLLPAQEATCTEAGYNAHHECSRCHDFMDEEVTFTPALHVQYELEDGAYSVTGLSVDCLDKDFIIPETYMGKPVTSIGDDAFKGCSGLTSIKIPNSVTSIGGYAFNGCDSLKSISIPDSVTSIGENVFKDTAYYNDQSHWDESDVLYIDNHLIEAKDTITGDYTIRANTKTIAGGAFQYCQLRSITIPEGAISIGEAAFVCCYFLASIEIPTSVTSIGCDAFYSCSSLASITIPEGVTSIREEAFMDCSSLRNIGIPDSVTSIERAAFYNCSKLTEIQFKGTVKEWHAIEKKARWDSDTGNYTITCTDGTIDKDGKVTYFEQ